MTLEHQKENDNPSFFEKMKKRWNVDNNISILLIIIAFSVNGFFSVWVRTPILEFFDIDKATMSPWAYWPLRIGLIIPIYQLTLPIVGAAFGQFKFFWAFQKKTVGRMFGVKPEVK